VACSETYYLGLCVGRRMSQPDRAVAGPQPLEFPLVG
jgi:hypothetical protein